MAAKGVTVSAPIVVMGSDPVVARLGARLACPGGIG